MTATVRRIVKLLLSITYLGLCSSTAVRIQANLTPLPLCRCRVWRRWTCSRRSSTSRAWRRVDSRRPLPPQPPPRGRPPRPPSPHQPSSGRRHRRPSSDRRPHQPSSGRRPHRPSSGRRHRRPSSHCSGSWPTSCPRWVSWTCYGHRSPGGQCDTLGLGSRSVMAWYGMRQSVRWVVNI